MMIGIVLCALGLKKTIAHVDDPLKLVPVVALLGGTALYLLALAALRWRVIHRLARPRVIAAIALLALIPATRELDALVVAGLAAAVLWTLIAYETWRFGELRRELRHEAAAH
jgi:low temperature requirement protein LtrA